MEITLKVPSMGESISQATVGTFLKQNGAFVKANDELIELETDKVNQVLYAPQAGQLHWKVQLGQEVTIGEALATIDTSSLVPITAAPLLPSPEPAPSPQTPIVEVVHTSKPQDEPQETPKPRLDGPEKRRKLSRIRQVIAKRLVEAQHETASLTTFNEVDMSAVIELRTKYQNDFTTEHGVRLGFLSFFIKAVTHALKTYPLLKSYIDGDEIVEPTEETIGVAVATDRGLVVPVIRKCGQLSFAEIEQQIDALSVKARNGKLSLDDLQGGNFTITNGGVFGSLLSTPLLNPPQSAILGMHKINKRPVVVDDQIVIRPMMYLALSYDHRLIDGKEAVLFLAHIKQILEEPLRLLLNINRKQ